MSLEYACAYVAAQDVDKMTLKIRGYRSLDSGQLGRSTAVPEARP